jgi:amidase
MANTVLTSTQRSRDFKPAFATALESAQAILDKTISAAELLNFTLRRVDLYNPSINAIVWQFRDRAIARARQADEALAQGRPWGPLHGVPVTIKEAFAYEGSPSTWGLPSLKDAASP